MSALKPWPSKGDKMVFLDCNGYDHEREEAAKLMRKGDVLTVAKIEVGSWSSTIQFDEFPGQRFNSVMFDFAESLPEPASPSTAGVEVVAFLEEAARYFENRPTNGEDSAHWSNVYNAENCRKAAASLDQATRRAEEAGKALLAVVDATRDYLPPDGIDAQECLNRILTATDNPTINPIIRELERTHGLA